MGKHTEPLDSLAGRVATGIHQVATFVIMAATSTREELDLAALVLRRDPHQSAPVEIASSVETFNRLLDVVIDSANESAGFGTRAERRAKLCVDLERKRALLIDSETLAGLIDAKLELDEIKLGLVVEPPGPIPLLEALEEEPCEHENEATAKTGDGVEVRRCLDCGETLGIGPYPWRDDEPALEAAASDAAYHGLGVTRIWRDESEHVPIGEFLEGGDRVVDLNPSVND